MEQIQLPSEFGAFDSAGAIREEWVPLQWLDFDSRSVALLLPEFRNLKCWPKLGVNFTLDKSFNLFAATLGTWYDDKDLAEFECVPSSNPTVRGVVQIRRHYTAMEQTDFYGVFFTEAGETNVKMNYAKLVQSLGGGSFQQVDFELLEELPNL